MRTRRDVTLLLATVALVLAAGIPAAAQEAVPAAAIGFQSERITVAARGAGPDAVLIHGFGGEPAG